MLSRKLNAGRRNLCQGRIGSWEQDCAGRGEWHLFRPWFCSSKSGSYSRRSPLRARVSTAAAGRSPWAINQVNADTGPFPDTIDFNIPGTGPFTIQPNFQLPTINNPVIIDGYSQPNSSPNTLAQGDNAVILIALDGSGRGCQ